MDSVTKPGKTDDNRLFRRILQIIAILVALAAAINLGGRYFGPTIAMGGHTDRTTPHEIIIGNNVLTVPANMMRFRKQRHDGAAARVELYIKWPDMAGYSEKDRNIFNLQSANRQLIFLTIEERAMSRDMSGRYLPIYSQLIEPTGEIRADGLTLHQFRSGNAYGDERLVISSAEQGNPEFVARCLQSTDQGETQPLLCERDIQFGQGLQLLYRFPQSLLDDWRALDNAMRNFANARLLDGR